MLRIMLVEDNPADAHLLAEVLKTLSFPYELNWKKDGYEALEFLTRQISGHARLPDLILMDVHMPRVGGVEALRWMKNDPALSAIPIIMLSTALSPAELQQIYESHANCCVQKQTTLDLSEKLVQALAGFWMEFAIFPTVNNGAPATAREKGLSVASATGEVRSQAMTVDGPKSDAAALSGSLRCLEHRRLMEDFAAAVKELLMLHQQQFEAAVHGDAECNRFDLLIHMANERKQEAKYAYLRHVEEHGCSNLDVINASGT